MTLPFDPLADVEASGRPATPEPPVKAYLADHGGMVLPDPVDAGHKIATQLRTGDRLKDGTTVASTVVRNADTVAITLTDGTTWVVDSGRDFLTIPK